MVEYKNDLNDFNDFDPTFTIAYGDNFESAINATEIPEADKTVLAQQEQLTIDAVDAEKLCSAKYNDVKFFVFYEHYTNFNIQIILPSGDTITYWSQPLELNFCEVDLAANNGMGQVSNKLSVAITDTLVGGNIMGIKHGNGKDWWVITPKWRSNTYHKLLISNDSIHQMGTQSIGHTKIHHDWYGQSAISPSGTKYAQWDCFNQLQLLDFDRCTGELSNPIHLQLMILCLV